jgi:hypothetical protein
MIVGAKQASSGFTIVELLVSAAVTLAILGVAVVMVAQARHALDRGSMGLDGAQRLRAGFDVVARDLRMAGAGPETGAGALLLPHAVPVVELLAPAPSRRAEAPEFGIVRVTAAPRSAAHGRLASMAVPGNSLRLRAPPDCPDIPVCGFRAETPAVVYDGSGAFERVTITGVDPASWSVSVSPALSRAYPPGAMLTEISQSTFGVDVEADGSGRLMRHTAGGAVQPIVDHVVAFAVSAFGDALPPSPGRTPQSLPTYGPAPPPPEIDDPRDPWPAGENCTITRAAGGLLLPRLPELGGPGELVAIGAAQLQDGPWCEGPSGEVYDADLYRLRRIDIRLRVEASAAQFRGPASVMFSRGGHGQAQSWVPDLELTLSVSPPNLGRR